MTHQTPTPARGAGTAAEPGCSPNAQTVADAEGNVGPGAAMRLTRQSVCAVDFLSPDEQGGLGRLGPLRAH